ncbi:MAG: MFS transporter [Proteobacteria bacterium]|nr:MFS transporter [Pseudomonadota bacterium]
MDDNQKPKQKFSESIKTIKPAFWLANGQEALERLGYFGIRAVLPLMMVSVGTGGLGLTMGQKGIIYFIWAFIQCMVPMVSGGIAESFGYKKSLIVAFCINTLGYLLMANILNVAEFISGAATLNPSLNFWLMMLAGCTIGLGTALFKPPVQGVVARSLNEQNSGVGFGFFYWVVNIGGFLAPMIASFLRGSDETPTWHYVFYGAAFVTLFNLLITILFFKEPEHIKKEGEEEEEHKTMLHVLAKTMGILWKDKNMLLFLLIVSGFWLMFMQLWDLLPNFIDEWVDRRAVGQAMPQWDFIKNNYLESNGALKPEIIINIDSATIILLVLPLSALFSRYKMMTALVLGMIISVIGFIMSGMTMSGGLCCLGVFIFAIGEIICSPKFNEYIGMTAPKDKKAIYMGFSNIPFAVGWAVGNLLSGFLYESFSSKTAFAMDWLTKKGVKAADFTHLNFDGAQKWLVEHGVSATDIPTKLSSKTQSLDEMTQYLTQKGIADIPTDEAKLRSLFDNTQASDQLQATLDMISNMDSVPNQVPIEYFDTNGLLSIIQNHEHLTDSFAATEILWNAYDPWVIWIMLGAIGTASMIGMIVFYYKSGMHKQEVSSDDSDSEEQPAKTDDNHDEDLPVESYDENTDASGDDKSDDLNKDDVENITIKD